jgi:hypothetical protein
VPEVQTVAAQGGCYYEWLPMIVGGPVTTRHADLTERERQGERNTFMHRLKEWGGAADRWNLGPQTSQAENAARQYCKRKGWVIFEGGYWRITQAGWEAFGWTPPRS